MAKLERNILRELNPFRPNAPEEIREVSPLLWEYLQEQAETLRLQHNKTQAGDTTAPWEVLTYLDDSQQYTLGSIGRFYSEEHGLFVARYVRFHLINSDIPEGSAYGLVAQPGFPWHVTNQLMHSTPALVIGIGGSYEKPISGQYGWVIISGVNLQTAVVDSPYANEERLGWSQSGILGLEIHKFARLRRGTYDTAVPGGGFEVGPGNLLIDNLSAAMNVTTSEEIETDFGPVLAQVSRIEEEVTRQGDSINLRFDVVQADLRATQGNFTRTARILSERMASVSPDAIMASVNEQIYLAQTYRNIAGVAADNAQAAAAQAFTSATSANEFSRSARIYSDEAGTHAESSTQMRNEATLSRNEAGVSASAAATSASTAQTHATNAGVSASAAQTSETNAATSASDAAGSAGTAATQASNAATHASNASTSASQASTSASNAAGSASTASTHATNAANSASTATTQAGVATTQAGNASTSASNAATSASNASGSASTASTHASNAATSASTAQTQAGIATTQAGNASTSASNAATSASNASGSASSASTSATAAASSESGSTKAALAALPGTFDQEGRFFSAAGNNILSTRAAPTPGFTYPTVSGIGKILHYQPGSATAFTLSGNAYLPIISGRIYRTSVRRRVLAGNTQTTYAGFALYDSSGIVITSDFATTSTSIADGWETLTYERTAAQLLALSASAVYIAAATILNFPSTVSTQQDELAFLRLEDITESTAAASSATAAATSASTATTQAGNAGTSASAAQTSATNAATSASQASTSASTASTQASNASTSASNASTSASTAATHASNASTSAGQAATSASTASTQASNASASAASASTSAQVAVSRAYSSLNPNINFSDWPLGTGNLPTYWHLYTDTTLTRVIGPNTVGYAYEVTVAANTHKSIRQYGSFNLGQVAKTNGWYVIEVELKFVSGGLTGCRVDVTIHNEFETANQTHTLNCRTDKDITGVAPGVSPVAGTTYIYRKLFQCTLANAHHFDLYATTGTAATSDAKTVQWQRVAVRPADVADAAVNMIQTAMLDASGNAIANFEVSTVAGAASAAIRMGSRSGGSLDSTIALEAQEFQVYDGTTRKLAMRVSGGNAQFMGDLNTLGAMTVGSRRIPVALQAFQILAGDGEVVSFGTDLTNIPVLIFDETRLAPKAATQAYDIEAQSLTSTGFTLRAKILTPGATSLITSTGGTNVGGTPSWTMHKTDAADANNGQYTFYATMTLDFQGEPGFYSATGKFDCYVKPSGGSWTYIGTVTRFLTSAVQGSQSKTFSGVVYYSGTIGQHVSDTEFGISPSLGTITAFGTVTYTKQATSGESSATPAGEKVAITVIPQNS